MVQEGSVHVSFRRFSRHISASRIPVRKVRSFGAKLRRRGAAPAAAGTSSRRCGSPGAEVVFFGVPLMLLAAFMLSFSGFLNAPGESGGFRSRLSVTPTVSVTVQPGESLWAIAGTVAPERDPRDVVADIVQLNNLDAGACDAGPAAVRSVQVATRRGAVAGRHSFSAVPLPTLNCSGD